MVTREENEMMTRVGRGMPAGELLRRYWQPVAAAAELTAEKPILRVTLLGEKLVLYRDTRGNYGLVGEQCPHRLASLAYGRVDDEGIRCPYHGWKFDATGRCLEQPAEPSQSNYKNEVRTAAYPVQKLGGNQIEFEDEDPAVHREFVAEIEKSGASCKMCNYYPQCPKKGGGRDRRRSLPRGCEVELTLKQQRPVRSGRTRQEVTCG